MAVTLTFYYDGKYAEVVEYAFSILSSSLECNVIITKDSKVPFDQSTILVTYGDSVPLCLAKKHLHIFSDAAFWVNFGKPESLPKYPLYRVALKALKLAPNEKLEDPLIIPYLHDNNDSTPVHWNNHETHGWRVLVCQLDLLASALFWLTRYEETVVKERDEFGRVPEEQLLCVQEECYLRPLVDEYAEGLRQLLSQFGDQISDNRQPFRVLLTHDVDSGIPVKGGLEHFVNGMRSLCRETIKEHRIRAGLASCYEWFAIGMKWRSYVDKFRDIVQLDSTYGFTSHFFMMANGTHPKDAQYNIYSEFSLNVIREIKACGGEIGLHPGINAHNGCNEFEEEWNRLREVCPDTLSASRSHYLVFQVPDTWDRLSEVDCRVDTTLGFNNRLGFRAGTSRPFRAFDVVNKRVTGVWEYPLILMDKNLFALHVSSDTERIEKARAIADKVAAQGGCLVVNWHNAYFFSDYLSMYKEILSYVSRRAQNIRLRESQEPMGKVIW